MLQHLGNDHTCWNLGTCERRLHELFSEYLKIDLYPSFNAATSTTQANPGQALQVKLMCLIGSLRVSVRTLKYVKCTPDTSLF